MHQELNVRKERCVRDLRWFQRRFIHVGVYLVKSTMVRPSWSSTFSLKFKSVMSMRFLELSTVIGSRFLWTSVGVVLLGVFICEKRRDGIPNFRAAV